MVEEWKSAATEAELFHQLAVYSPWEAQSTEASRCGMVKLNAARWRNAGTKFLLEFGI